MPQYSPIWNGQPVEGWGPAMIEKQLPGLGRTFLGHEAWSGGWMFCYLISTLKASHCHSLKTKILSIYVKFYVFQILCQTLSSNF
jgi:hypothetical protein